MKLTQGFHNIANIGLKQVDDPIVTSRVRLTNYHSIINVALFFSLFLINLFRHDGDLAGVVVPMMVFCFFPLLLNHYKRYNTASILTISIQLIGILWIQFFWAPSPVTEVFILALGMGSVYLFYDDLVVYIFSGSILVLFLVVKFLGVYYPPIYADRAGDLLPMIFYVVIYVLAIGVNTVKKNMAIEYITEKIKREVVLEELDKVKSTFYTNISHEFRTPLTVIKGLANQARISDREKRIINQNCEQLLDLVNQMLELRKLESGTLAIKMVHGDILKLFHYLVSSFQYYAKSKQLTLELFTGHSEIYMDYDAEKMTRIFSNLVSNAIKFTTEGGTIKIRLKQYNHQLIFKIEDTGVGIPQDQLVKIFNRYYQVEENGMLESPGTGIGLTLVAELVNTLDGSINVSSLEGRGTTFTIALPIRQNAMAADMENRVPFNGNGVIIPPQQGAPVTNLPKESDSENKPIALVIEDHPDVLYFLNTSIMDQYSVISAINGEQGIEMALKEVPDIIISDVMMPGKDGYEVCEIVKNEPGTSHIPVILLTAKADQRSKKDGLKKGADAYLTKPFDQEELLLLMQQMIELRRKLQKRYQNLAFIPENPADREEAFLNDLRELIIENIKNPGLSVDLISQKLGMSKTNLHRKLKSLTGHPLNYFIRQIRMQKAKALLISTELNIREVSFAVGYSDPKYFSRVFANEFSQSPRAFRKEISLKDSTS